MRADKPTFKHRLEFAGLYLVFLMGRIFPRRAFIGLGTFVGRFCFDVLGVRKQVTLSNLRRVFGEELDEAQIVALGRRSYESLGRSLLEFCSFWNMDEDEIRSLVRHDGLEHLEAAFAGGRGCILVTGHYGSWELCGTALRVAGYRISFLVKDMKNPLVARLQDELRDRAGVGYIKDGPVVARGVLRALNKGEIVGILPDQDARRHGVFVDFLGHPASTYKGPAFFSYRANVPIVTVFIRRLEDGTHESVVQEPIRPDPSRPEAEEIHRLTQAYTDRMNDWIRKYPEEYFWVHRRWKTGPPADAAASATA